MKRSILLIGGALLAIAVPLLAAPPKTAPERPTPRVRSAAMSMAPRLPVRQYQLKNGLTVLLSPDHRLPVVTTDVRYMVGSSYERKGRSGFAHLFEHLMFQGSEHFNDEYFKPFEPVGGAANGSTTQDRTNFFERVPSNYLRLSLWMESDRMEYLLPALDQKKLDNQRAVVKNERRQRFENQPYGMVWVYLAHALFPPGHPYHHPVIGSMKDLSAASLSDVRAFFHEYYVPANAILTICGDFKPARAKRLVREYFGSIPGGHRAPVPQATMPTLPGIKHIVKTDNVKLPRVYLAWESPALFAPGDADLDLLSSVLSSGKTSRLYEPLVYKKKLATDVAAYQASMRLSSIYIVQATAAPGKNINDVADALLADLKKAIATPPTRDEMKRALNGYEKSFFQRVQDVTSRAALLSTYYHFTGNAHYIQKDLARYTRATPAQVQRAAKRWLDFGHYVRLDIVPGPKAGGAS